MLDWHSCQICYPLEIKLLLLFVFFFFFVICCCCFFVVPLVFCDPPTLFKVFQARSINLYIYTFPGQPPRQYITSWCSFFRQ